MARLLLLLAVLLMPLGMAPAAATGQSAHATMQMRHCPEQVPTQHKAGFVECTMACSSALPAVELASERPRLGGCEPARPVATKQLHGLHPETATPPPRLS